jgi:hypothetical protein
MIRNDNFTLRVNPTERMLITAVAERLERTESDAVRLLLREKARELGITPVAHKEDRHVAQPAT